ncbi:hypothetical protein DPMN_082983 [Dreissena polymorpha]|uniref:Uncharacterized protein n=1 Tax=Dreissena polymorpha TaxID=45954 RepID=A0A9D3Y7Y9_DREPO|nr:hypothetical protein DPMN_082983 [Dreissena polymorpha]
MGDTRDMFSRQSTGSATTFAPDCSSSLALIRDLYQKLEPQMTKSYRPHVTNVPPLPQRVPSAPRDPQKGGAGTALQSKGSGNLKSTQLVLSAVAELKKRRDRRKISDDAKRLGTSDRQTIDNCTKVVSKSLPNITGTDEIST